MGHVFVGDLVDLGIAARVLNPGRPIIVVDFAGQFIIMPDAR
jgi:hypothetical protein